MSSQASTVSIKSIADIIAGNISELLVAYADAISSIYSIDRNELINVLNQVTNSELKLNDKTEKKKTSRKEEKNDEQQNLPLCDYVFGSKSKKPNSKCGAVCKDSNPSDDGKNYCKKHKQQASSNKHTCCYVFGNKSKPEKQGQMCGMKISEEIEPFNIEADVDGHDYKGKWLCKKHFTQVEKFIEKNENKCQYVFGERSSKKSGETCNAKTVEGKTLCKKHDKQDEKINKKENIKNKKDKTMNKDEEQEEKTEQNKNENQEEFDDEQIRKDYKIAEKNMNDLTRKIGFEKASSQDSEILREFLKHRERAVDALTRKLDKMTPEERKKHWKDWEDKRWAETAPMRKEMLEQELSSIYRKRAYLQKKEQEKEQEEYKQIQQLKIEHEKRMKERAEEYEKRQSQNTNSNKTESKENNKQEIDTEKDNKTTQPTTTATTTTPTATPTTTITRPKPLRRVVCDESDDEEEEEEIVSKKDKKTTKATTSKNNKRVVCEESSDEEEEIVSKKDKKATKATTSKNNKRVVCEESSDEEEEDEEQEEKESTDIIVKPNFKFTNKKPRSLDFIINTQIGEDADFIALIDRNSGMVCVNIDDNMSTDVNVNSSKLLFIGVWDNDTQEISSENVTDDVIKYVKACGIDINNDDDDE